MNIRTTMKRCLTICLSLALMLAAALPASVLAAGQQTFSISQEGVDFIKEFEGFRAMAYLDNGKWYIGYGVLCNEGDYPDGIDEIQAELLMREALADKEEAVNRLITDNGLDVTQQQYDALVSFTYNMGIGWMKADAGYRIYDYLVDGIKQYTEEEIVNAFGGWCHQGTKTMKKLVDRRLREAYLFLYGEYDNKAPEVYTYIDFDADGGEVEPNRTIFYRVGTVYGPLPVPTRPGYGFLGWYTADGQRLTGEETAEEPMSATASWVKVGGTASLDFSNWVNPFTDVEESQWFFPYVRELNVKKIVAGFPDMTFRPDSEVSAGEALKLILLAAGHPDPGNALSGGWASLYLALAEEMGFVAPGEITDLSAPIDRLTVARLTAAAMGLPPNEEAHTPFADVDDGYVRTLCDEGIFIGNTVSGKRYFYPDESFDRAELVTVVSRISNWEKRDVTGPEETGYIEYFGKKLPVLAGVPRAAYDQELFVKSGSTMFYNDPDYTTAIGIDVSSYQGDVDWQKVAASGVEFVMLRVGYRGYTVGQINPDSKFAANLAGATAAGLDVGVYFYSQAITEEEAREEARFVLDSLAGVPLTYPVAFDWEIVDSSNARTNGLGMDELTACAIAFCEEIAASEYGYTPMIYAGREVAYTRMDLSRLTEYDLWYPQYANVPSMYYNYRIWQYSCSGSVPGISGDVDMDLAFIPYG